MSFSTTRGLISYFGKATLVNISHLITPYSNHFLQIHNLLCITNKRRLPLEKSKKLELSSRHHRNISTKLYKLDTYLKPAWPLWTRREVFCIDGEAPQMPLPNGQDYGGFRTTLEAFIEGYDCASVEWIVQWKNVRHPPQFCLLEPKGQSKYTAHQLLAVFRALRFNDFFKSLSFCNIDFSGLSGAFDNASRLESTVWLSRTGSSTKVAYNRCRTSSS